MWISGFFDSLGYGGNLNREVLSVVVLLGLVVSIAWLNLSPDRHSRRR